MTLITMKNYCFTLAYNLPSETEKVTKLLYEQNQPGTFEHTIFDLGFPIVTGDEVPKSLEGAKKINSSKLIEIAARYGSNYAVMENIGVSQNWTQAYQYLKPENTDVLIGCDPDEHPLNPGWVKAMGNAIREGDFGLASLMMTDHVEIVSNFPKSEMWFGGARVYIFPGQALNWALIGLSGRLLNLIKAIPYPPKAQRYGWIEGSLAPKITEAGMRCCILPDYKVRHTDFELGDPGTSSLLREWKNQIIFNIHQYGQMSFDSFLMMRKEGRI
jgi:hypothetical protein